MFNISSRIKLKKDTVENWNLHSNYVLYNGEIAIVVFEDNSIGIKIGDGITKFANLNYILFGSLNTEMLNSGQIINNSGIGSAAFGDHLTNSGQYSIVAGTSVQNTSNWTFTWNGDPSKISDKYLSHGNGTFNINPDGGIDSFYIGEDTLREIITDIVDSGTGKTRIVFNNGIDYYTYNWKNSVTQAKLVDDGILNSNEYLTIYYWIQDPKTIIIGTNVRQLSDNLFDGCSTLTNITIPESVTSIGQNVFKDCTNLQYIIVKGKTLTEAQTLLTNASVPQNVKIITYDNLATKNDINSISIPTKTSDLTNDGSDGKHPFLTNHQSLENYVTKTDFQTQIGNLETIINGI